MTETATQLDLKTLVSLCKRRGFVFQSSEIYGGLGSVWDYGPMGVELKRNVKEAWWRHFVWGRDDIVGLDSAILMHPDVWRASGHVGGFADPFYQCSACGRIHRADHVWDLLWESEWFQSLLARMAGEKTSMDMVSWAKAKGRQLAPNLALVQRPEVTLSWMADLNAQFGGIDADFKNFMGMIAADGNGTPRVPCPACGAALGEPEAAALMLETSLGPMRATAELVYLRPETAQGIFVNFDNVLTSTRRKLPFGIAQVGKAFRNEITTGNFIFRTREFEMMEIEFFVQPGTEDEWFETWVGESQRWYSDLGLSEQRLRVRPHESADLSHYSKATSDIEYSFPWGWGEIQGTASRTDYDLKAHSEASGQSLTYFDNDTNEHVTPFVVEPSFGVDRAVFAFLADAYVEEEAPTASGETEKRVVLKLDKRLSPVKVAVLPLSRNEKLTPLAREVFDAVRSTAAISGRVEFDDAQSIGRRYRRHDEIGTPMCVTVDFDSIDDKQITIRDRDTMKQDRVAIDGLAAELARRLAE